MDQHMHRERKDFEARTLANLTCCLCEDDAVFYTPDGKFPHFCSITESKIFILKEKQALFIWMRRCVSIWWVNTAFKWLSPRWRSGRQGFDL